MNIYNIPKNNKGKRLYKRRLNDFELSALAYSEYNNVLSGCSTESILEGLAVAKRHIPKFKQYVLKNFMLFEDGIVNKSDDSSILKYEIASLLDKDLKLYDMGFVYCLSISGRLKIGKTRAFTKRLGAYKSHIGVYPEVVDLKFCLNHSSVEKEILKFFDTRSEWFEESNKSDLLVKMNELCG